MAGKTYLSEKETSLRLFIKIAFLLLLPATLLAQDTAVVKKQAEIMGNAMIDNNYSVLIDYTYPKLVKLMGGKEKMLQYLKTGVQQMKSSGFRFKNAIIGSPGRFYTAGSEIHCLIPETLDIKTPKGTLVTNAHLLAISQDNGKSWTFVDISERTMATVKQLFPNFNHDLKIPKDTEPIFTPDDN